METKQMFDKVKGEVSSVLSKVAGKAEHVAKISKLKLEIATRKSAINSCYQEIGEYIFSKKDEFSKDSFLADIFKEIDELNRKNEVAQKETSSIKTATKEKFATEVGKDKPDKPDKPEKESESNQKE